LATKKISKSKVPLIHHVIPIFDVVTTALEDHIDKSTLPLVVRHAALRGYLMLNKYYSLTDDSIVYRVAMSVFFIRFSGLLLTFNHLSQFSTLVTRQHISLVRNGQSSGSRMQRR